MTVAVSTTFCLPSSTDRAPATDVLLVGDKRFIGINQCSSAMMRRRRIHPTTIVLWAVVVTPATAAFMPQLPLSRSRSANVLKASPLSLDNTLTTVISLYPTNDKVSQDDLVAALKDEMAVSSKEGFVSAHIHASLDGEKVGVYEQWQSLDAHKNHMKKSSSSDASLASVDRHVYEIVTSESNLPLTERVSVSSRYPLVHFAEFIMSPENQPKMMELAKEHIHPAMQIPGLLSATFHRSTDGVRVINYGQWENEKAIERLKQQPGFSSDQPYWEGVADNEHHLYHLVASFETK